MTKISDKLSILKAMAGEGNFYSYKLLKKRKIMFLFLKYLITSFSYFWGKQNISDKTVVAYAKGINQLRHHRFTRKMREERVGDVDLYTDKPVYGANRLPRISIRYLFKHIFILIVFLFSRKKKYLNLYYLSFYEAINDVVIRGLQGVRVFICYNDQPYDVAAIVHNLNKKGFCKTVVVQHGLIVSQEFYFPTIAQEFWAWGELSREHFASRLSDGKLIVVGRYAEDKNVMRCFYDKGDNDNGPLKILVAVSYDYYQFYHVMVYIFTYIIKINHREVICSVKLHPATKLKFLYRLFLLIYKKRLNEEVGLIEDVVNDYDVLISVCSSSLIDFILRGKPVFTVGMKDRSSEYCSKIECCLDIRLLEEYIKNGNNAKFMDYNKYKRFLGSAINV